MPAPHPLCHQKRFDTARVRTVRFDCMATSPRRQVPITSVADRAESHLEFIRRTMERSSTFTAVPGIGGVRMGGIGLAAALIAARQSTPARWLIVWLSAAAVALLVGVAAMRSKASSLGSPLTGAVARRFAMGLAAPLVAGAVITSTLWRVGAHSVMPSAWLLLYGAGVLTGGMFSAPIVRATGAAFMALGLAAALTPSHWGNVWLALGFGGLHIVFGIQIARHHGG